MRIISLGWGVQSWTIAAMAALNVLEADVAIHADTLHEKSATYAFARQWTPWLEAKGLRVVTVSDSKQAAKVTTSKTDMPAFTLGERKLIRLLEEPDGEEIHDTQADIPGFNYNEGRPPIFTTSPNGKQGQLRRQCTGRWKVQPIRRWIAAELAARNIRKSPGCITSMQGISLDEWTRMKDSDVQWIVHSYPLVDMKMTRADCEQWLVAHGLPIPPKSACVFCPFQSINAWRELKRAGGPDWAKAVEIDSAIRDVRLPYKLYVHPARLPLNQAISIPEDAGLSQANMFDTDSCDSGYCFT